MIGFLNLPVPPVEGGVVRYRNGAPRVEALTGAMLTGFTVNRVPFAAADGSLTSSANLTFDASTLALTGAMTISGQLTSSVSTGTAPLVVASTTVVANLNASLLLGSTWAAPAAIGSGTPAAGSFTTLTLSSAAATSVTLAGGMVVGETTARQYGAVAPIVQLSAASAAGSALGIVRHNAGGNAPRFIMGTSRGVAGTATAVQSGDVLFQFDAVGADGTDLTTVGAQQIAVVDAAVSTGVVPTGWRWDTRNSGGTLASRMTLSSGGNLALSGGSLTLSAGAVLATTTGTVHSFTLSDAATNSSPECVMFRHNTSGTPAAGFGQTVSFLGQSSTTTNQYQFAFQTIWADPTHASRKARTIFNVYDTAAREAFRFEASGTAPMVGFLGASATARETVTGSRGGNAALADLLTKLATKGIITDGTSA